LNKEKKYLLVMESKKADHFQWIKEEGPYRGVTGYQKRKS
jgi:hypothetical protein